MEGSTMDDLQALFAYLEAIEREMTEELAQLMRTEEYPAIGRVGV
jgi:hypothetical protein